MAIQFMDNFESYNGSNILDGLPWSTIVGGVAADPDPGSSGKALLLSYNANDHLNDTRLSLPQVATTVGVALRFYLGALPTTNNRPCLICPIDNTVAEFCKIRIETNGAISLYSAGDPGTLIATTTNPVVAPRSWFHLEFKFNATSKAYEIRLEGVSILSGTATAAGSGTVYGVVFSPRSNFGTNSCYIKDVVIWDGTGTQNNNFVGSVGVFTLRPASDISTGWTNSTGVSNYPLVNEALTDDTNYISAASTLPAASIMSLTDLPATVVSVRAVQTVVRAKKTDGGDATLVPGLVSGASTGNGGAHAVTTAFKYWADVQELDPATAALWSPISVNAMNIKLNRTL